MAYDSGVLFFPIIIIEMKILYDHQIFTMQTVGGVSRYFTELMSGVEESDTADFKLSLKYSNNVYLEEVGINTHKSFFKIFPYKGRRRIQRFLNNRQTKNDLQQETYDIFHPTYYHPYHLNYSAAKPLVLTVYDMIHERLPHLFPKTDNTAEVKKALVERADKIIAISKSTKKDLVEILDVNEEKVKVVYLANSLPKKHADEIEQKTLNLPEKFIFFVGRRSKYKNFTTFLNASIRLLEKDENLEIVCTASHGFGKKEKEHFRNLGILDRIHAFYLNEQQLQEAYKKASVFVFPSLYEGFGLPLLEAFSASCPVVCSHSSSLPEIAENAAVYFNPLSEHEIENAISKVIYDKKLRQTLIDNGKQRLKEFSWQKTVDETLDVYRSVIN